MNQKPYNSIRLFINKNIELYKGVMTIWKKYWVIYGGARALFASPYLHLSIIITICCKPIYTDFSCDALRWYELAVTVLPSLLGFTLGGFAILLAFGDEKFKKAISGPDDDGTPSPFMITNVTFLHFIIVQIISLLFSVVAKVYNTENPMIAFIGFNTFIYSLTLTMAAAFAILNYSNWFDLYAQNSNDNGPDPENQNPSN